MARNATGRPNTHVDDQWVKRYSLTEDFRRKPGVNADLSSTDEGVNAIASSDFEVVGTNAATAGSTFSAGGGIVLTTQGTSLDQMIATPHLDTTQTAWASTTWSTSDEIQWGCVLQTGAAITATTIWAGLKLTNVPATVTDANQAMFRYNVDTNSGKWEAVTSVSGTDTETDTKVTAVLSTEYILEISIDVNRVPKFVITTGGVSEIIVGPAMTAAVDLIPYIGVMEASGAAARTITVRKTWCSKEHND